MAAALLNSGERGRGTGYLQRHLPGGNSDTLNLVSASACLLDQSASYTSLWAVRAGGSEPG